MNKNELWQLALSQIKKNIAKANFAAWFQDTEIVFRGDKKVTIAVPNAFSKGWLETQYYKQILKRIHSIDNSVTELEFTIKNKIDDAAKIE